MLLTGNYGLRKPELGEPVDVRDFNYNADIIDTELKRRPTADGGASGLTVEFEEAVQLTELTSGDSLRGLFGKLKLAVRKLLELIKEMENVKKSVSDGKTLVAGAITGQGVKTAADAAFQVMADNITAAGNKKYGEGVAAADGRENPTSANYIAGYNAGVIAADARVNSDSANYKAGYDAGYSKGLDDGYWNGYHVGFNDGTYHGRD